jgi:hypothetical protein
VHVRTSITCESCGTVDALEALPDSHTCSSCGEVTVLVQKVPKKAPQPKRTPFSPGWKFMADVVSHPERGLILACDSPPAFKQFVMEVGSQWKAGDLARFKVSMEVVSVRNGGALVVRLLSAPPKEKRRLDVVRIPAERLSRKHDVELAFPAEGESELEKLVASGSSEVINRIEHLASQKDDPTAWWKLALGHRSARIRRPVEQALLGVGIEKIDRMLRQSYRFDWDVELLEFVGVEMAKPHPQGGRFEALPGDRSGWDKPWWADD